VTIRVVVADDQSLVRAGFRVLLERAEGIEVVGEAENGAEAVELARSARPDVILMDIRMPVLDGLAATRKIVADDRAPGVHVIMLTTFELDEYVFEALRAGASGFLLKNIDPDDLRRAVRVVAGGDALLSPSVTKRLIAEFATRPAGTAPDTGRLAVLTGREREVVALVGRGLSNDEIGRHLHMSPATARTHVSRAMTKLDVRDRPQLVVLAYETHLVTPGE
jgi:DNA-binding NarL/FixJ family response regulator